MRDLKNGVEQNVDWIVAELAKEPPDDAYGSMPRDDKKTGERNEIEFLPIEYVIGRMQEIFGILGFSVWCDNPIFSQDNQWVYVPVEINFALPGLFPKPLRGIGTFTNTGEGTFIKPDHAVQTARSLGIKEIVRMFPAFEIRGSGESSKSGGKRQVNDDYNTVVLKRTVDKGKDTEKIIERTVLEWGEKDRGYLAWTLSARDPKFSEFQATLRYALEKDIQLIRDALMQRKVEPENVTLLQAALTASDIPAVAPKQDPKFVEYYNSLVTDAKAVGATWKELSKFWDNDTIKKEGATLREAIAIKRAEVVPEKPNPYRSTN